MARSSAKFSVGDTVLFLGSSQSRYGSNSSSDKYIGWHVTISQVHRSADPHAYTIKEFDEDYGFEFWFSENCFEMIALPELPEFEACEDIGILF